MKKLMIIMALLVMGSSLLAQDKTPKPKYNYFVVIPFADYQQIMSVVNEYKGICIYDPKLTNDTKVKVQQTLDQYLNMDLPKRLKTDSVKVDSTQKK